MKRINDQTHPSRNPPSAATAGTGAPPSDPHARRRGRWRTVVGVLCVFGLLEGLAGCSYVGSWAKQRYYSFELRHSPRQRLAKHLVERPTFLVFGKVQAPGLDAAVPVVVLAISQAPAPNEVVDVSRMVRAGSYYGLNLPPGDYQIVAAADRNGDHVCTEKEVVAERRLTLSGDSPERVKGDWDLEASASAHASPAPFSVAVAPVPPSAPSVFYPRGTLRELGDPIFAPAMGSLGLYEPAAFLEAAPMMFYALEEELGYKVPVIFVHGIGGSAREFEDIVRQLDRRRYRAWFFHYPSGGDLRQLSAMFYEIFLAGTTMPKPDNPLVIVAHSMGGLVVRDALNRCRGTDREATIAKVITIASPLGGHPAAARAKHAPLVLPAWRNLDPEGTFVRDLHRKPLPAGATYTLFYTLGESAPSAQPEDGDGTVPLASQLTPRASAEATTRIAVHSSHTGVLHDQPPVARIVAEIEQVKSIFPDDHLRALDRGGYDLALPAKSFSALDVYFVRYLGHYLDALVAGEIQPIHPMQQQYVDECLGRRNAETPAARAWLKLDRLYPHRRSS